MDRVEHVWRALTDGPSPSARNMAIDRAIQRARAEGLVPPTVRLYEFRPPAVSLGRFQSVDDVDLDACERLGIDVCRRPTGGRGVLHDDEVTYSVVASTRDGMPRGVAASYRYLGAALASAYQHLGVSAHLAAGGRGDASSASCYLQATKADLVADGAKISGSAQVWEGEVCLQHGSFVLSRDAGREAAVLGLDDAAAASLDAAAVTIEDVVKRRPSQGEVAKAVETAFAETLGVRLVRGALTSTELHLADELEREAEVFSASNGV